MLFGRLEGSLPVTPTQRVRMWLLGGFRPTQHDSIRVRETPLEGAA